MPDLPRLLGPVVLGFLGTALGACTGPAPCPAPVDDSASSLGSRPTPEAPCFPRWGVEATLGVISNENTHDAITGLLRPAVGERGGVIPAIALTRTVSELHWSLWELDLRPRTEAMLAFGLADQNGRAPFGTLQAAYLIRWVDFRWNDTVETTLASGPGLHWTTATFEIDEQRYKGDHRSQLKFFWPIQFTFALPAHPHHQLTLFNHHISGGRLLDEGGFDWFGFGYRYTF